LDVTRSEGPRKGETVLAIYEVKGDSLRTCFAPPGRERPTGFTPKEGSGHVLRTYKRVKPGSGQQSSARTRRKRRCSTSPS